MAGGGGVGPKSAAKTRHSMLSYVLHRARSCTPYRGVRVGRVALEEPCKVSIWRRPSANSRTILPSMTDRERWTAPS